MTQKRPRELWRLTACEGKERFATFAAAESVRKRHRGGGKIRRTVYHCRDCNSFHLGTRAPL